MAIRKFLKASRAFYFKGLFKAKAFESPFKVQGL
jgi:hypothetical protein